MFSSSIKHKLYISTFNGNYYYMCVFVGAQAEVDAAVQTLLSLKKQYKQATGKDWTPPKPGSAPTKTTDSSATDELDGKIRAQGDKVRQLKADKAPKVCKHTFFFLVFCF